MNSNVNKKIKTAPKSPGVYIFYQNRTPLYVGKASNLKNRLQSYLKISDVKTQQLHEEADRLKLIELNSPIEALIEEARLIKELSPRLNVYWRDDKNYFYVAFTKEEFPKIFITHQPKKLEIRNSKLEINHVGPFTDGQALRLILKILRHHYPYCTCLARRLVRRSFGEGGSPGGGGFHLRDCLNAQIGLCAGYCCNVSYQSDRFNRKQYQKNIKTIKYILGGQKKNILKKLIRPEDNWAAENILEHSRFLEEPPSPAILKKIECYDISNFAGKEAVGAFTVLVNQDGQWLPDRSQFRKFKIKDTKNTRNDPAMLVEILRRRLNHPEWPYPDLIIIDGGTTHYNAARTVVKNIPVISFAKPNKKIYGNNILPSNDRLVVEKAIDQTHRYVINYHRQVRGKIEL